MTVQASRRARQVRAPHVLRMYAHSVQDRQMQPPQPRSLTQRKLFEFGDWQDKRVAPRKNIQVPLVAAFVEGGGLGVLDQGRVQKFGSIQIFMFKIGVLCALQEVSSKPLKVVEFPSESNAAPQPRIASFQCRMCPQKLMTQCALVQHERAHASGTRPKEYPTDAAAVAALVQALLDAPVKEVAPEEWNNEEKAREEKFQQQSQILEYHRYNQKHRREKEAKAREQLGTGRRGSMQRIQYSPIDKVKHIEKYHKRVEEQPSISLCVLRCVCVCVCVSLCRNGKQMQG